MDIKTVLCPLDFSSLSERELILGCAVAERFEARLVVHHNLDGPPPTAMAVGWMRSEEQRDADQRRETEAQRKLEEFVAVAAAKVPTEGRLSRGSIDASLIRMVEETGADLVVMGTHGRSTEEHSSATHAFLEGSPCPVLTLRDLGADTSLFQEESAGRLYQVLVPLDFADYSLAAMQLAFALAETLPLHLQLLHVMASPGRLFPRHVPTAELERARGRLEELVPEGLRQRVECSVSEGAIGKGILAELRERPYDLVIMGTHHKDFFSKILAGAPSQELLYGSGCPVLFVPKTAMETTTRVAGGQSVS